MAWAWQSSASVECSVELSAEPRRIAGTAPGLKYRQGMSASANDHDPSRVPRPICEPISVIPLECSGQ